MGSMSASDAAPLPRLGEVFFDVRGESRTMRLSWYADTGVAVFSIWQGGTCTGTFRLPIADLPRMVEALQRGPHGHDDQVAGEQPGSRDPRLPARAGHRGKAPRRRRGSPPAPPAAAEAGPGRRAMDGAGDPGEYPAGLAPDFPGEYPAGPPPADFTAPRGSRHRGRARDEDPGGYL